MDALLGVGQDIADVTIAQMALRTIVVYGFALGIVRLGSKRFLSKASAFDMIVAIMLGSIMSRAITGSVPFLKTMVSGAALVGAHWLLASLAYRLDWLGPLVKGKPVTLITDGIIDHDAMRQTGVSDNDLEQALRTQAPGTDPSRVHRATLERNGSISVVPADKAPRIIEVSVENGVQTVRVEI